MSTYDADVEMTTAEIVEAPGPARAPKAPHFKGTDKAKISKKNEMAMNTETTRTRVRRRSPDRE